MAHRANHRARQTGFPCPQIAFQKDHRPGHQQWRQQTAQAQGCSLVRQVKNGGNIGAMHDQNSTVENTTLKDEIRLAAARLGFTALGVASAEIGSAGDDLRRWLAAGFHGEMDYMARHAELRANPAALHPGTISVISVAIDYLQPAPSVAISGMAVISKYAQGRDYHKVVRNRLQKLAEHIAAIIGPFDYRVFSDSAPVMEVHFASQAGVGWRGKHTLLLSKQGSWRFLGEIYCDLPLTPDIPVEDHCGSCTACLDACPTQAIVAPYEVDARRCISYLTIELAGAIPEEFRSLIGKRIYGCDDCQSCCPWNRFAQLGDPEFAPRHGLDASALVDLFAWTPEIFNQRLAGSPIRRIGYQRWLRNIAVALGNCPPSETISAVLNSRLNNSSPLVREHILWALSRQQGKQSQEHL